MAETGIDIKKAASFLKDGNVVGMPTETVYGLAGNALNVDAVARIFEVKKRPSFDPLIVHFKDDKKLHEYCQVENPFFRKLYQAFSPGPITYILPKKEVIPDLVTAGHNSVGVRFPAKQLTQDLLASIDFPLAAPSANPFGFVSPVSAAHVNEQLGHLIPYILDGGTSEVGLESTIIDLTQKQPAILRLGGLSLEQIEEVLGFSIEKVKTSSSNPKAPGMLSSHYSPGIPVLYGHLEEHYKTSKGLRLGSISFKKTLTGIPLENQRILSPEGDLKEAASQLFKALRSFSKNEVDVILAETFPEEGLGRAINDRLRRAAAK